MVRARNIRTARLVATAKISYTRRKRRIFEFVLQARDGCGINLKLSDS